MMGRMTLRAALLLWLLWAAVALLALLLGPASAAPILAYTAARGGIRLYDAAQGIEIRFAELGWPVYEFTWSPDGAEIIFLSEDERRDLKLMRVDARGQQAQPVAGAPRNLQRPAWSPDGTRVAFEVNAASGLPDLYALHLAEARIEPLYRDFAAMVTWLDWSPDGRAIVFSAQDERYRYQLGRVAVGEAEPDWLTAPGHNSIRPDWSPDGRYIAYQSDADGRLRLMLLDLETGQTRGLDLGAYSPGPVRSAWSPDAQKLALLLAPWDQTQPGRLGVVDVTSGAVEVLPYSGWIYRLAWSPDGRYIAFAGRNGPSLDVMLYDLRLGTTTSLGMTWSEGSLEWRPHS